MIDTGHGGGGVRPNADGPRPLGSWQERELMVMVSSAMVVVIVIGRYYKECRSSCCVSGEEEAGKREGEHFQDSPKSLDGAELGLIFVELLGL